MKHFKLVPVTDKPEKDGYYRVQTIGEKGIFHGEVLYYSDGKWYDSEKDSKDGSEALELVPHMNEYFRPYAPPVQGEAMRWVKASDAAKVHFKIECGRIVDKGKAIKYGEFHWNDIVNAWFDVMQRKVEDNESLEILCDESAVPAAGRNEWRVWDKVNKRIAEKGVFMDVHDNFYQDQNPNGINMSGNITIRPTDKYELTPAPAQGEEAKVGEGVVNNVPLQVQLCPKCHGQGIVSKPPWITAEVENWTSAETSFTCDVCNGTKVITMPLIPSAPLPAKEEKAEVGEGKTSTPERILDKHMPHRTYQAWGKKGYTGPHIHEDNCDRCEYEDRIIAAMEEYAATPPAQPKEDAVGFAEWTSKEGWEYGTFMEAWGNSFSREVATTAELYNLYLTC
jgi:hypothetical protein